MGSYVKSLKQFVKYGNFGVNRRWFAQKHNMGMALTRKLFDDKIKKYAKNFCSLGEFPLSFFIFLEFFINYRSIYSN